MSSSPAVVIKKGGVLTALVSGIFGTLIVCILCVVALGWYALDLADRKVTEVIGVGRTVIETIPEWTEALPAAADMLNDRRSPAYIDQIDASARIVTGPAGHENQRLVVEVTNNGDEIVTLLTARVVFLDADGVALRESRTFVATPLCLDEGEWRGPLQPGKTRQYAEPLWRAASPADVSIEITDLRVWAARQTPTREGVAASPQAELPAP